LHSIWMPRIFASVCGLALFANLSLAPLVSVMFLLSVSHTLLAAYYSRNRALNLIAQSIKTKFLLLGLVLISAVCIYFDSPPMYLLIFAHHLLNESYTSLETSTEYSKNIIFKAVFILFEIFVFVACTQEEFAYFLFKADKTWLYQLILVSSAALFYLIHRYMKSEQKMGAKLFILTGLIVSLYSLHIRPLNIDFMILYHFLFWLIYPALKSFHFTQKLQKAYWVQTAVLMLAVLPLTLLIQTPWSMSVEQMSWVTRAFAYFHIFTSLALSASNPDVIINLFQSFKPAGAK
jgi:hypothetical protein